MKTTYVLTHKELSKLKVKILPRKEFVDYYFGRMKMVRWDKQQKFVEYNGMIDISFCRELLLDPDAARSEINLKNVEYLVRRKQLSEYHWENINEYGVVWKVSAEDVKKRLKLLDEYHLVFDSKIESPPPFGFQDVFYGNLYDFLVSRSIQEEKG